MGAGMHIYILKWPEAILIYKYVVSSNGDISRTYENG